MALDDSTADTANRDRIENGVSSDWSRQRNAKSI